MHDDDQEILRLVAWDGLGTRQLALALGCKESAARVRLHRARRRLAGELQALGNGTVPRDRSSAQTPTEGTHR